MQPPYRAREHESEDIQVLLVGAAPVIGVRKRQQAWRTWSALAAGLVLVGLIATVLTSGDDASIKSQAKTSESNTKTPRAAASLRQLLKEQDRRSFPSLQVTDVKRARACGPAKICHFHGYASLAMHTDLAQYEKDTDSLTENKAVHKTADTKTGVTIEFDVYETDMIGCKTGEAAFSVDITMIHMDDALCSQDGTDSTKEMESSDEEAELLELLQAHPFVFIQSTGSGLFEGYYAHPSEQQFVSDFKRSIVKDLNPVIGVNPALEAKVRHGESLIFQMHEKDMNGRHHAVVKISSEANSGIKTEHVRQLLQQGEDGLPDHYFEQPANEGWGNADEEPNSCPYPVADMKETNNGKSHRTSTSDGDEMDEYDEDAELGLGSKVPETVQARSKNEQEEEEATGMKAFAFDAFSQVKYKVKKISTTPKEVVCDAGLHASTRQQELKQRQKKEQLVLREFDELFTKKGLEVKLDAAAVQHEVQILVQISAKQAYKAKEQKKRQFAFEPNEDRKFEEGCEHEQVRGAMFALLKGPDTQRRRDLSKKFLAGCSAAIHRDEAVQQDLVMVAKDLSASKNLRSRSLHVLLGSLRCPAESTVEGVKQISDSEGRQSEVQEAATLVLGGLLRKHRQCRASRPGAFSHFELDLNRDLHKALGINDSGRAQTVLYGMTNSASGSHLDAIGHALKTHGRDMRSMGLKDAATSALTQIGQHDTTHNKELRQSLLQELQMPPPPPPGSPTPPGPTPPGSPAPPRPPTESDGCPDNEQYAIPALCYGFSVPPYSTIQSTFDLTGGMGSAEAISGKRRKCAKYIYNEATIGATVKMGGPFENVQGFDPLVFDVLKLTGQGKMVSGHKIGGELSVFGFVVKTWGSGILEPEGCDDSFLEKANDFLGDNPLINGGSYYGGIDDQYNSFVGVCGFPEWEFDTVMVDKGFQQMIPGVEALGFVIGPVGIGVYADFVFKAEFTLGAMAAWLGESDADAIIDKSKKRVDAKVFGSSTTGTGSIVGGHNADIPNLLFFQEDNTKEGWEEKAENCARGGGAALAKFEVGLGIEGGVQASIAVARARLGVEVIVLNLEARGNGELLKTGVGKEVWLEVSGLSGRILTYLDRRKLTGGWKDIFAVEIWAWNPLLRTGNIACKHAWFGGKHHQEQCRDSYNDCCASPEWGEPQTCADGYQAEAQNPGSSGDCANPDCYQYGDGMGCYKCVPNTHPMNFGCATVLSGEPWKTIADFTWIKVAQALGKGYGAFIQNPGAWLLSDGKASLVEILCFRGKECNDEDDEDDALEPSRLDAPKKAMLVLKSQMQGTGGANVLDCDYLDPIGVGYRGAAATAADGSACLPWPQSWAVWHHGSGLVQNTSACSDLPEDTECWQACLAHQETNNFCRNPDDSAEPFCRTGGDDENPVFSACSQLKKCA